MHGGSFLLACDTCLAPATGPWKPWLLLAVGVGVVGSLAALAATAGGRRSLLALATGLATVAIAAGMLLAPMRARDEVGRSAECPSVATNPGTKLDPSGQEVSRLAGTACEGARSTRARNAGLVGLIGGSLTIAIIGTGAVDRRRGGRQNQTLDVSSSPAL